MQSPFSLDARTVPRSIRKIKQKISHCRNNNNKYHTDGTIIINTTLTEQDPLEK
jgi:hypothetical protein